MIENKNNISQFALVYAINNNIEYIAKCLHSIWTYKKYNKNLQTDIYIIVDQDFLFEDTMHQVFSDIKFIYIDKNIFANVKSITRYTSYTYYRFIIFNNKYFNYDYEYVMYADCDTEFKNSIQLHEINNIMQHDKFFGLVIEVDLKEYPTILKRLNNLINEFNNNDNFEVKIQDLQFYCNSGILFFNLKTLHKYTASNELFDILMYCANTVQGLPCPDQDIINYVFSSNKYNKFLCYLPSTYNLMKYTRYKKCNYNDAIILHYAGLLKYNYFANKEIYNAMFYPQPQDIIDINTLFNNAYMICVDEYSDRLELEKKLFNYHKIPFPKIFKGTTNKGECNSAPNNSHMQLIQYALDNNLPYILVFEDDAYPINCTIKNIEKLLQNVPKYIQFIQLGYIRNYDYDSCNGGKLYNIITNSVTHGAHAYIIRQNAYQKAINLLKSKKSMDKIQNQLCSCVCRQPLFLQYNFGPAVCNNTSYRIKDFNYSIRQYILDNYTPIEIIVDDAKFYSTYATETQSSLEVCMNQYK